MKHLISDEELHNADTKFKLKHYRKGRMKKYLTDEDGYINLTARFEGTDALDAEEEEILVRDLILELNLEEIDSVKTIFVKASFSHTCWFNWPLVASMTIFGWGSSVNDPAAVVEEQTPKLVVVTSYV